MSDFIRADAWIGLCDLIDELGGDSSAVLAASGLSGDDLLPVDRYLPMTRFIATLNHAVESTGRKDFGLRLGQRRQLTHIGVVGLAMANGDNWRSIIDIAARIGHIANPLVTYAVEPGPHAGAQFIWVDDRGASVADHEQAIERTTTFILRSARNLVRPDFVPLGVHFRHDQMAGSEAYVDALGVMPLFNQPKNGLIVATEDLDRAILSRSSELRKLALSYLEDSGLIEKDDLLRAAEISARSLVELGAGTADDLAQALEIEKRTLQRRLKQHGVTIEQLLDDARRSLVERLLTDGVHTISQIAYALGYATPAPLTRNCKRWFGDTPANLRKRYVSEAQ